METQISLYTKKLTNLRNLIITTVAALIVFEIAIAYSPIYIPVMKRDFAIATSAHSEKFTELYFENHTQLPDEIFLGDKYNFSFTIRNEEQSTVNYQYQVYIQRDDTKIVLDQNQVSIDDGNKLTINEEFGPLQIKKMEVVVELVNKNQKISFWMRPEGETL